MIPQGATKDILIFTANEIADVTKPISYQELLIEDFDSDQDQIVVLRIFDTSSVSSIVSNPLSIDESKTVWVLPKLGESGSSMYSLDSAEKTITFSTNASDYNWEDVNHHSRGSDVALPVVSSNDTIIIANKTASIPLRKTWSHTDFISAFGLNSNIDQILKLVDEWSVRKFNFNYFDYSIGKESGVVPLNSSGIVLDSYFPNGIGGSGSYVANLEGTRLDSFGDVRDTMALEGYVLEYQMSDTLWTPRVMFRYLADTGDAVVGGVLRRLGSGSYPSSKWTARLFKLGHLSDMNLRRNLGDDYFPKTAEIVQFIPSENEFQLSGLPINLNLPTYDGWVLQWNNTRGRWEANSTIIDEVPVFDWVPEKYYLADMVGVDNNWVTFPPDTDWSNRPSFLSDENTWTGIPQSVLGFNASIGKWQAMPYNFHRCQNFWSGSTTTDTSDPGYTGEYVGTNQRATDQIWQDYKIGDVIYWEPALYQKNQDPATEDPKGAFKVGKIFEWDPDIPGEQATASDGRGDSSDPEAGIELLQFQDGKLHLDGFKIDSLNNVETTGSGGILTPRKNTFLMYDPSPNVNGWVPYEVDTGEEIYQREIYSLPIKHHVRIGANYSRHGDAGSATATDNIAQGWNNSHYVNRIYTNKQFMPCNGTLVGYKIMDFWQAIKSRALQNPYPEPQYNSYNPNFGLPEPDNIPYNAGSSLFPFIIETDFLNNPLESDNFWIMAFALNIDHIRPDYDSETLTITNLVTDAKDEDSSGDFVSLNQTIQTGDIIRVSLSNTFYTGEFPTGTAPFPQINDWNTAGQTYHVSGTICKWGTVRTVRPDYDPLLGWSGFFNADDCPLSNSNTQSSIRYFGHQGHEQIGAATVHLKFDPDAHS